MAKTHNAFRTTLGRIARPLRRGWPDEDRYIAQYPFIRAFLAQARAERKLTCILNAGAGEGMWSVVLLSQPALEQLDEVDVSYDTFQRKGIDERQHMAYASLTELPFDDQTFDLVLCTEVLEHIPDDGKATHELARVTRVNGYVLVSVPTPPAPFDPAHVREGYTELEIKNLLSQNGLETVNVDYCMRWLFQLTLIAWRKFGGMPRVVTRSLTYLDRTLRIGRPMDIVVLAKKRG